MESRVEKYDKQPDKEATSIYNLFNQAVSGKINVLNGKQIKHKAIQAEQQTKDPQQIKKYQKLAKKATIKPFMYRAAKVWDKPKYTEDNKHGSKLNDPYFINLARSGNCAKKYRQQLNKYSKDPKAFHTNRKVLQQNFENHLQGIDYENYYASLSNWYQGLKHHANKNHTDLTTEYRQNLHKRNVDPQMQQDKAFMNSMKKHFQSMKVANTAKASKNGFKKFVHNFRSKNYQGVKSQIKHGFKQLFHATTGIAKKAGHIATDRLTTLGEHLQAQHPKFRRASARVTKIFDKGARKTDNLLQKIDMPRDDMQYIHTSTHTPHTKAHNISEVKHHLRKTMHRTQHLDMGPAIS